MSGLFCGQHQWNWSCAFEFLLLIINSFFLASYYHSHSLKKELSLWASCQPELLPAFQPHRAITRIECAGAGAVWASPLASWRSPGSLLWYLNNSNMGRVSQPPHYPLTRSLSQRQIFGKFLSFISCSTFRPIPGRSELVSVPLLGAALAWFASTALLKEPTRAC